jgi:TolB-like protein
MSDGLTDEIINHLYKIASFDKVVSFSTVRTFKGTDKKIPQIADELQVRYILEGTYKKIGDQVRVTAQLIDPKNDKHIWQNPYDQPYKEITTIQADIALQIADNLKAYLTSSEKQNIQKIPTKNQEAYDLLQQALYLLRTRGLTVAVRAGVKCKLLYGMLNPIGIKPWHWIKIVMEPTSDWDCLMNGSNGIISRLKKNS